ncbi:MAG: hypothetical protein QME96_16690 [Myxococcota bacterium]|nr:hypothetical protein [Myxococcota bacterium]
MRIENGCTRAIAPIQNTTETPPSERPAGAGFRDALVRMIDSERRVDGWIDRAVASGLSDPRELLRLQVTVHRFQTQIELAAKAVEQASQAVRTLTRPV